jgi:hypothetical protein
MSGSSSGGGFYDSDDQMLAAVEHELGPEIAARIRRRRDGGSKLTDAKRAELWANLDPLLRDLQTARAIEPTVTEETWRDDEDTVTAWLGRGGPYRTGIRVLLGAGPGYQLTDLAEQVQEWEIEALAEARRPATWPECPAHPRTHPLRPVEHDDRAVWSCPSSGDVICPIGELIQPDLRDAAL